MPPVLGMTGAEAVAEVQQGLGWRSDRATEILRALNWAQDLRELGAGTLPWFLTEYDHVVTVTSATVLYALPDSFLQETEERDGNLRYQSSSSSRTWFLKKMDEMSANRYFFGDWQNNFDMDTTQATQSLSPGVPRAYVLRETSIKVFPIPDTDYNLLWNFFKADEDIVNAAATNKWLTHCPWLIVGGAGAKLAADILNAGAVKTFASLRMEGEAALLKKHVQREIAARPLSMGSRN